MKMETITSTTNPTAKRLKSLNDSKGRRTENAFLVEGEVMIREALSCGLIPLEALSEKDIPLLSELNGARLCTRSVLESVCDTKTPQGICASFRLPDETAISKDAKRIIALDGVQDPGNVGTILRTADAAGFEGVLLDTRCPDIFSPKVQRASMGSLFRMPCIKGEMQQMLENYQAQGYKTVVAALDGLELYTNVPGFLSDRLILVIGNEAKGVSAQVQNSADIKLKIPMRGKAESLNAAVAAGIMMYELTRDC